MACEDDAGYSDQEPFLPKAALQGHEEATPTKQEEAPDYKLGRRHTSNRRGFCNTCYSVARILGTLLLQWRLYIAILVPSALCAGLILVSRRNTLMSCLVGEQIPFLLQGPDGWPQEVKPWNLRLEYNPAAVATPQSIDQIQAAVNCGVKSRVRVSAKGGGHSFGGYGFGGEDGHLVIALDGMQGVDVKGDNTTIIRPGTRLGVVATELYRQGNRAIPHGWCPE